MNLLRSASVFVAAALTVLVASNAAAQAPTVTWQQIGTNGVRAEWTAVPGATHYEAFVNGVQAPMPILTTFFQVSPVPAGSYQLQIRAAAGSARGPLSAPVTIMVTGAPSAGCGTLEAPVVTVSTSGMSASVNWTAVSGAAGYILQVGTSPGATQYQQQLPPHQTSFSSSMPAVGTFYVRVVTGNACGARATSSEQSFTIGAATPGPAPTPPGTGPRTPDPAAGTLIPRASLSYLRSVVEQAASQYRGDLLNSCATHTWMYRVVAALRQIDTRWGLNYKRGWNGDLSHDVVAYNPTSGPDEGASQIYLFDIIGGHCGNNPGPNWLDVTDPTWAGRGDPACAPGTYCARWTLVPYLRAGFPADGRQ